MSNKPRKLSVLLHLCLHIKTSEGLRYGMCAKASELRYRAVLSLEEVWIVKEECMQLVHETRLQGAHNYVDLLRSALLQRLQGNHIDVDDMCYLIYSCWIDKLESEGK